jgi:hypothetical protein
MQKILKICIATLVKSLSALDADEKAKLTEAAEIAQAKVEVNKSIQKFESLLKSTSNEAKVPEKVSNCTNKLEIMELIPEAMTEKGDISRVELKTEVEGKLRKLKRNLSMYSKLFDECVEEFDFTTMVTEELALAKARNKSVAAVTVG